MNNSRVSSWICGAMTLGLICTSCAGAASTDTEKRAASPVVEQPQQTSVAPTASAVVTPAPTVAAAAPAVVAAAPAVVAEKKKTSALAPLKVKRLVVARGVSDREPVLSEEPLVANGTPIYAFAELANPDGETENVRITFERKGGKERAGDVVLPVPAKVTRHRTWAFTRHIFMPGEWDAVLRSESGVELGRTSFDVQQG